MNNKHNNKTTARKVLHVIDAGLCHGLGDPILGQMCIIAAKRFACGLEHGDTIDDLPVGSAVRAFEIALNDAAWSSTAARAAGLRRLSVAEWGSDTVDQLEFLRRMALKTINVIIPLALRATGLPELEPHAVACAQAATLESAVSAVSAASHAASAAARAVSAASHAASAASHAVRAACYAASYAASAASYASYAASYAASAASAASYAASHAASAASYAARDKVLALSASLAVEVLVELGCPGCAWLDELCGE